LKEKLKNNFSQFTKRYMPPIYKFATGMRCRVFFYLSKLILSIYFCSLTCYIAINLVYKNDNLERFWYESLAKSNHLRPFVLSLCSRDQNFCGVDTN